MATTTPYLEQVDAEVRANCVAAIEGLNHQIEGLESQRKELEARIEHCRKTIEGIDARGKKGGETDEGSS